MSTAVPDNTYLPPAVDDSPVARGVETVRVEHVHIRYRMNEDMAKTLRAAFASLRTGPKKSTTHYVHALKDVTFTAYAGEAIGVIGSNGSGKSTLMRAIAGLLPITEGAVYAKSTPMLLGVGAVLNKQVSGRKNIMLGGLALGLTAEEVLSREREIIEFAGIKEAIDRPMATYSSGMKARLQFAISAAVEPEILIIDEALSVGDRDFKKKSEQRVRDLRESAGTVFIVSHGMKSIRHTCTRVLWIEDGVLMADGPPDEVIPRYNGHDPEERRRRRKQARRRRRRQERLAREAEAANAVVAEG